MRFSAPTEHTFFSGHFFVVFSRKFRYLLAAAVIAIGAVGPVTAAHADPAPDNADLTAMFWWVTDEATGAVAYSMTAQVSPPELRDLMREFVLLRVWATGGNPWKINPTWVAPTGP